MATVNDVDRIRSIHISGSVYCLLLSSRPTAWRVGRLHDVPIAVPPCRTRQNSADNEDDLDMWSQSLSEALEEEAV